MGRETLPFKTMREIKTGFDVARRSRGKIKTTQQVMKRGEKIEPKVKEKDIEIALDKERRRFKSQMEKMEKGKKKVKGYREKLAGQIEKNTRLMELRHELQKQYWKGPGSPTLKSSIKSSAKPAAKKRVPKGTKEIKLGY